MSQRHVTEILQLWNCGVNPDDAAALEDLFPDNVAAQQAVLNIPDSFQLADETSYDPCQCPDWVTGVGASYNGKQAAIAVDNGMYLVHFLLEDTAC